MRVVDRAAEYVEEASVFYTSYTLIVLVVEFLRVLPFEAAWAVYADEAQIFRYRLPYAGNALETASVGLLHKRQYTRNGASLWRRRFFTKTFIVAYLFLLHRFETL